MDEMQASKKPKRNWGRIALIASLAINLLIVGVVVGAMTRIDKGQGRHFDRVSMGMGIFIEALPDDALAKIKAAGGRQLGDRKSFRNAVRKSQRELESVVLTTPYSELAVRAAIVAHRKVALGTTDKVQEVFIAALSNMSEPERADFNARVQLLRQERNERRLTKKWRNQ